MNSVRPYYLLDSDDAVPRCKTYRRKNTEKGAGKGTCKGTGKRAGKRTRNISTGTNKRAGTDSAFKRTGDKAGTLMSPCPLQSFQSRSHL